MCQRPKDIPDVRVLRCFTTLAEWEYLCWECLHVNEWECSAMEQRRAEDFWETDEEGLDVLCARCERLDERSDPLLICDGSHDDGTPCNRVYHFVEGLP